MTLSDKSCLCYIKADDLFSWIEKNELEKKDFFKEKFEWEREIDKKPNFFSDTELLLSYQDIILLKISDNNHCSFLAKSYKLEHQITCQRVFQEKKNILIISDEQWKDKTNNEDIIILFKDKESIQQGLKNWLKELKD